MPVILSLPPRCTLVQAEEIASECRAALSSGAEALQINASALEEGDVSLLQIVIAARNSCEAVGRAFSLTPSPVLEALAARAGLLATPEGLVAAATASARPADRDTTLLP